MDKKYIIAVLAIVVASGLIFYACQKEENKLLTDASTTAIFKSNHLENPFHIYGKAHNAALDAIAENDAFPEMIGEDIWNVIKQPLEEKLSADYMHLPYSYSMVVETYRDVKSLLNNNNLRFIVNSMANAGILNRTFSSDVITRNNYDILYNYWTQMEQLRETANEDIDSYYELTVAVEQEIISNYYSLIESGLMNTSSTETLYREYTSVLVAVSIGVSSAEYWCYSAAPNWGNVVSQDAERLRVMDCARIDFLASCRDMIRQSMEGYDWFDYGRNDAVAAAGSGQGGLGL